MPLTPSLRWLCFLLLNPAVAGGTTATRQPNFRKRSAIAKPSTLRSGSATEDGENGCSKPWRGRGHSPMRNPRAHLLFLCWFQRRIVQVQPVKDLVVVVARRGLRSVGEGLAVGPLKE